MPRAVRTRRTSGARPAPKAAPAPLETIRASILDGLFLGTLQPGDRLPSMRTYARRLGVSPHRVLAAYALLEREGLVLRRPRSGVFVAPAVAAATAALPETAGWMVDALTEACRHRVRIPLLPALIHQWTSTAGIRCACVDDSEDGRFALVSDLSRRFGLDALSAAPETSEELLHSCDFAATTPYHSAAVAATAAGRGVPLLVATTDPGVAAAARERIRTGSLTIVCVDRRYGERFVALQGGSQTGRLRIVTTEDSDGLAALDPAEPVLMTAAARQRLPASDLRLLVPPVAAHSLAFARSVLEVILRINLNRPRA